LADSIETLGSYSIFPFLPDYSNGIDKTIIPTYNLIEYTGTISTIEQNSTLKPLTIKKRIQLHSMEDLNTFLTFFDTHKGRLKKFWCFLRTTDFTLDDDIANAATEIDIKLNGYADTFRNTDRIYWTLTNGDSIVRRVTDAVDDTLNDQTTLIITPSVDRAVDMSEVVYFGRVLMVRFDIDKVNISFESNSVAVLNLRFLELPTEYPAT